MINVKYNGKRFKIYSNGRIDCLDKCLDIEKQMLKEIVERLEDEFRGPEKGFLVSNVAHHLPRFGVEVISYRDYEMENAPPDRVY